MKKIFSGFIAAVLILCSVSFTGISAAADKYSQSGSAHRLTGMDFVYGLNEEPEHRVLKPLSEDVAKARARIKAFNSDGTPLDLSAVSVDAAQLADFNSKVANEKGGAFPLTFSLSDGLSITVNVYLQDRANRAELDLSRGSICANDNTGYDIALGELSTDTIPNFFRMAKKQTNVIAFDAEGNRLSYEDITVDAAQLEEINKAIRNGDAKYLSEYTGAASEYHDLTFYTPDGSSVSVKFRLIKNVTETQEDLNGNDSESRKDINLGTSGITDPVVPAADTSYWSGSHVYFGTYSGKQLRFRVLDASTNDYGGATMLLDSDSIVKTMPFDSDGNANSGQTSANAWSGSDIQSWMNGTSSGEFLNGFTGLERSAIAYSSKAAPSGTDGEGRTNLSWCALSEDKVFALDAKEATSPSYGYSNAWYSATNRKKAGVEDYWWLRSAGTDGAEMAGLVLKYRITKEYGLVFPDSVKFSYVGASPALNINLSAVMLCSAEGIDKTSEIKAVGSSKTAENTWKLTLKDEGKKAFIQSGKTVTESGGVITVPYAYTGDGVSQISLMITSGDYTSSASQILYYGALDTAPEKEKTAEFRLPSGLPQGYKVYILAEDVNSGNATDYASLPFEIITGGQLTGDENPFADVKHGDWYYDSVQYAYEKGLMVGTSNTTFEPDATTDRGMIVTILYRLEGEPSVAGLSNFPDVPNGEWYANAVAWAKDKKISYGDEFGNFCAGDYLTREQLAAFLYRYAQLKGKAAESKIWLDFTDISEISDWAEQPIKWCVEKGIISGKENNNFDPQGEATRAEAAAMISRFLEKVS